MAPTRQAEHVRNDAGDVTDDADASNAPNGPAGDPGTWPDETSFRLPTAWSRHAEPFRGRRPAPVLELDVDAVHAGAAQLRERHAEQVAALIDHPRSDPDLVRAARRHLGTGGGRLRRTQAPEADPLGAAVELAAIRLATRSMVDGTKGTVLADDLVLRHGAAFAADAVARLATVGIEHGPFNGLREERWLTVAPPDMLEPYLVAPLAGRVRAHLAGADDATYADATARLAMLRQGPLNVRLVTSYLAPTEQAWVDEDVVALPNLAQQGLSWPLLSWPLLLASATTHPQIDAILACTWAWSLSHYTSLVYTLAANLGVEAAEPLARVLDDVADAPAKKRLLAMLAAIPSDEAFAALTDRADQKYVPAALMEAMGRYPVRAARLLATRAATGGGTDAAARSCQELLRGHLVSHPGVVDRIEAGPAPLDAGARRVLDGLAATASTVRYAEPDALPSILVTPPWEGRKRTKPTVVAGVEPAGSGLTIRWAPGEQVQWAETRARVPWGAASDADGWEAVVADAVGPRSRYMYNSLELLAAAPPDVTRRHLDGFTPQYPYDGLPALQRILGRVDDEAAAAFTFRVVMVRPSELAPALLPLEGPQVAAKMAGWLVRAKNLRSLARTWLARHPDAAARDLVPLAVAKAGKDRAAAEAALRVLDQAGHGDLVRAVAEAYGDEVGDAVAAVLDTDPLDRLPAKVPARPPWLVPAHLPPVLLADGQSALPPDAVGNLCTMLALSKPGDTYAGVAVVQAATDPASLAEMAWALFERWHAAGFPAKDGWVLEALGLVGDDETVRRISPLIRVWPKQGGHARAVAALDVLSGIGSDLALMHLHTIAEKAKGSLRGKAREKMDEVADGLGLSAEQLADRLVPDFGLDRDGTMVLDYGARRFTVGFDEQLKPLVIDDGGARRKVLPRPGAKDDPALAPAAYARFSGLKKDVKAVAADQIRRFERAMVQRRRWTVADQRALFVDHPLLWHLARRLVWVTVDGDPGGEGGGDAAGAAAGEGAVTGAFRVAEDRTLADVADEEITLTDGTWVGVAHPLHLGGDLAPWSDLFADYEILQPFAQLGRDTWALTAEERGATVLRRLTGITVETGRILGLSHRGWARGPVMDGGVSSVVQKEIGGGRYAVMDLDPGLYAGAPMEWPEQQVGGVWLSDGPTEWGSTEGKLAFADLDDVSASELLRDIEHLKG